MERNGIYLASKDNLLNTVHEIFQYSDEVYAMTW